MTFLPEGACKHVYFKFYKELTALAKLSGVYSTPMCRYLCYWEVAAGYQTYVDVADLRPEVEQWLKIENKNSTL